MHAKVIVVKLEKINQAAFDSLVKSISVYEVIFALILEHYQQGTLYLVPQ